MQLKFKNQQLADYAPTAPEQTAEDLFGRQYSIGFLPYAGVDFSKKCFVFPGQSAAVPEMGREDYNRHEIIQKRFAVADALAKQAGITAPSLYIENPSRVPAEDATAVQCLALFTMSVALFELLLLNNEKPSLMTSHSFGEYAMLVASGMAGFEDMFHVVLQRDRVCPPTRQAGSMIAVSGSVDAVRKALGSLPVFVANINSPGQVVVSVGADVLKTAQDAFKKAKLAIKVLDTIPQPYHSALLALAAAQLEQFIQQRRIRFSPPQVPVLSSVTGQLLTAETFSEKAVVGVLAKQLVSPVDFVAQIQAAVDASVCNFVELAHHKVCTPWIKETLKEKALEGKVSVPLVLQAEDKTVAAAQKGPAKAYDKKLVGLLNKVVSSVTGYSINEISLTNNFQEDLGIDSIKKAQIILSFLESQGELGANLQDGVAMSEIRNIEDVLAWYQRGKNSAAEGVAHDKVFALYEKVWEVAPVTSVDRALAQPPANYAWVAVQNAAAELPAALTTAADMAGIVFYDNGAAFSFDAWMAALRDNYAALAKTPAEFNFVSVMQMTSSPNTRALDAFIKALGKELQRNYRALEFDVFSKERDAQRVIDELTIPFRYAVRFEKGVRYAERIKRRAVHEAEYVPHTVAAIGGAKGVTLAILQGLIAAGSKNIAIMGRSAETAVQNELNTLRQQAAEVGDVSVIYFSGDATNKADLEGFIKSAAEQFGTLDLLINGGGIEVSALLPQQTEAAVAAQCGIKITTTQLLAELAETYPITRIDGYSSVAGEFGSPGQTIYSYANIALTYWSEHFNRQFGRRLFTALAWPAWNRVGMADNDDTYRQMLLAGVSFLEIPDGQRLYVDYLTDATASRCICIDHGTVAYMSGGVAAASAVQSIFPGATGMRSPLPLTAWTLRNLPDLKNHAVLESAVVPMSLYITMFFYMAYLETGKAYTLHDIKAKAFMLLHQKESPYFLDYKRVLHGNDFGFTADMRSNDKHVELTMQPATADDIAAMPTYVEPDPATVQLMDSQYDVHNLGKGDFKEGFGVLRGIRANSQGYSYATLSLNPPPMRLGNDAINWLALVVEFLLQLGGVGARVLSQKANAPVSVKQVLVNPAARRTNTYKAICKCEIISDDIATGDMWAYNEDGEVFVHIKDAQVRMWGFDEE